MSAPELASRLVRAFGTDAAVTRMTAADLKAMGKADIKIEEMKKHATNEAQEEEQD